MEEYTVMRIAILANNYGLNNTGGAAIASTRLHNAMVAAGYDVHYICVNKMEEGPNVYEVFPKKSFKRFVWRLLRKVVHGLFMPFVGYKSNGIDVVPLLGLERLLREINPDILHVHRTNAEVASFRQLAHLPYRIVFHLHDIWAFNLMSAYPGRDLRYIEGANYGNATWPERLALKIKRKYLQQMKPLFIGPSDWICRCCSSSIAARDCETIKIHYIFDERFIYDEKCRTENQKFTMLFGCFGGTHNPIKGWDDVSSALKLLSPEVVADSQVFVFGESIPDFTLNGIHVHILGNINQPDQLVKVYNSADVFLLASREDNSPLTKFEALYCGIPVLAFNRTGCAEEIETGANGVVVEDGDIKGYVDGITHYYRLWKCHAIDYNSISTTSRNKFATSVIVEQMGKAYRHVMEERSSARLNGER